MTLSINSSKESFDKSAIVEALTQRGWVLLKERFDEVSFSTLLQSIFSKLTFDPARDFASSNSQKVDAGTASVGLHIENGHTPLPPHVIAFFSKRSACIGSQTTICDGVELMARLPKHLQNAFSKPVVVSRTLPERHWKTYIRDNLNLSTDIDVTERHLQIMLGNSNQQSAEIKADQSLCYRLTIQAIRNDNLSGQAAFANALLGPSYNYEKPTYHFKSGEKVSQQLLDELSAVAEQCTHEIQWCDGDVVIIDNLRCMHGRRKIEVPLSERQLSIGMGFL